MAGDRRQLRQLRRLPAADGPRYSGDDLLAGLREGDGDRDRSGCGQAVGWVDERDAERREMPAVAGQHFGHFGDSAGLSKAYGGTEAPPTSPWSLVAVETTTKSKAPAGDPIVVVLVSTTQNGAAVSVILTVTFPAANPVNTNGLVVVFPVPV